MADEISNSMMHEMVDLFSYMPGIYNNMDATPVDCENGEKAKVTIDRTARGDIKYEFYVILEQNGDKRAEFDGKMLDEGHYDKGFLNSLISRLAKKMYNVSRGDGSGISV